MFLKQLDFISPSISLHFKGDTSHVSIFSGILTIIAYIFSLSFGIYFARDFFLRKTPQVFYYNRYVSEAGSIPVNSDGVFSFIQITDMATNTPDSVDFDAIRIIGIELDINLYKESNDLNQYDHWIYGNCNKDIDTKGISELITFEKFNESACIRKYYKKSDKKYYNTNDKNFRWPSLDHGCSHPNRTFYGIIVEKCRNDSLRFLSNNKWCKSTSYIIKYMETRAINFQVIDQFTDILNYKKPLFKYFYAVSNGFNEDTFTTNHLNFNPLTVTTNDGLFIDTESSIVSYYFDQNEKNVANTGNSGIYSAFYFWLQNRMQYQERTYQKIQEALSDIGGLGSIVLLIAEFINLLVSRFTIINDTDEFLTEISAPKKIDKNMFKNQINSNNNINNYINKNNNNVNNHNNAINFNINNNSKNNKNNNVNTSMNRESHESLKISQNSNKGNSHKSSDDDSSSNYLKLFKESIRINNTTVRRKIRENLCQSDNFVAKRNNTVNDANIRNDHIQISKANENKLMNTNISQKIPKFINNKNLKKKENDKNKKKNDLIENENEEIDNENAQKSKKKHLLIKFIVFIGYLLSFRRSKSKSYVSLKFYDSFRRKIISEENIILNYFNTCKLIQI